MQKWLSFQSATRTGSVAMQTSHAHKTEAERNRRYVPVAYDIVKLLAKLGLPFRGHDERRDSTTKGNFLEMCFSVQLRRLLQRNATKLLQLLKPRFPE